MRFLILIVTVIISTSGDIYGRPPFIHDGAWIANNDTTPLHSREYKLLVFRTDLEYDYLNRIAGIAETSTLQCYDGNDIKCAKHVYLVKNCATCPPKMALEIITQLM